MDIGNVGLIVGTFGALVGFTCGVAVVLYEKAFLEKKIKMMREQLDANEKLLAVIYQRGVSVRRVASVLYPAISNITQAEREEFAKLRPELDAQKES